MPQAAPMTEVLGSFGFLSANNESIMYIGTAGAVGKLGGVNGTVYNDGLPDGTTSEGTVTAATSTTLTKTGATFTITGNCLKNLFVAITEGTGAGQIRRILSNTAQVLTISSATFPATWTTTPDTTSQFKIGSIRMLWQSYGVSSKLGGSILPLNIVIDKESTLATPADITVNVYKSGLGDFATPTTVTDTITVAAADWTSKYHALPLTGHSKKTKFELISYQKDERLTINNINLEVTGAGL